MERPLSTFVIVSFILSFVQMYLCYSSFGSDCKFEDSAMIAHSMWVMIEGVFAVVNIIFALYFQRQVWGNIISKKAEFMEEVNQDGGGGAGLMGNLKGGVKNLRGQLGGATNAPEEEEPKGDDKIKVKSESVQASFKEVFLKDFGVLAYFFGLIAVFVISYMGNTDNSDCKTEKFVEYCGMAFFWVAFIYTFCWYCCKCCAGTVTLERDEVSEMA